MRPIPEACRESMERARFWRDRGRSGSFGADARRETREILRALRTLRREEAAGILGVTPR